MSVLTVRHVTTYRYRAPVQLGEHRMMFRPRESHDLKLLKTSLSISPYPSRLRWQHDVFDNSIAIADFEGWTTELRFESVVTLEHFETTLPKYPIEDYAASFPFHYSHQDTPNLTRALAHNYPHANVSYWVKQFLDTSGTTGTMDLLRSITHGIKEQFQYVRRSKKGIQSPDETIASGQGTCRDFAVLMMEATRSLGVAARFVSGYILVPGNRSASDFNASGDIKGGGATHAWMQAFLPGAGWIDFDPTNAIVGNRNLIRVAMAWSPEHVLPLWGTFIGRREDFLEMDVTVNVAEVDESLLDGLLPTRY
ncbi:MAG TPA: transglutaminase family protein [Candidatus Acidoferrales bacterium]|jgi:transglutaminase-like putative cysteine protease|nr:transglutaminase family protein [Candidatus Acidoferrales bacterium]